MKFVANRVDCSRTYTLCFSDLLQLLLLSFFSCCVPVVGVFCWAVSYLACRLPSEILAACVCSSNAAASKVPVTVQQHRATSIIPSYALLGSPGRVRVPPSGVRCVPGVCHQS